MNAILTLIIGKIVDALLKAFSVWIAAQSATHKKVNEYNQAKIDAVKKGKEVETNPSADPDQLP